MITTEQALALGIVGVGVLAGFLLSREIDAKSKKIVELTANVAALTQRLEIEAAKQPDAIKLTTPQITTETKEEYVKRNTAPTEHVSFPDMLTLKVGDTVIYASGARGRVLRIAAMESSWVVETTHGTGEYAQWGTEAHGGDNIKGVVR